MNKTSTRAAIYSRVSTTEQTERGGLLSCDAQDATNRQWASAQGLTVVAAYRDEGRSGTNLQRPGWAALLAGAKAGEFGVVVVTYMDRLGRGDEFVIAREDLRRAGAAVAMSLESFADDMGGYIAENMVRVMGGFYAREVSRKVKSKLVQMVQLGLWPGGAVPVGYRTVDATDFPAGDRSTPRRLAIDDELVDAVLGAYEAAAAHGRLVDAQDALLCSTSRGWDAGQVRRLLTNPIYTGRLEWGGVSVDGFCAPIVSAELFERVQSALARAPRERRVRRVPSKVDPGAWLFTGRIRCACGAKMGPYWTRNNRGDLYTYYECYGHRQGLCAQGRVSAPRLHDAFASLLSAPAWRVRMLAQEAAELAPDTREAQTALAAALRAQRSAEAQVSRLTDAIAQTANEGARGALVERLGAEVARSREAGARVRTCRAELERTGQKITAAELVELLGQARGAWEIATEKERRELVEIAVEGVMIEGPVARFALRHWQNCGAVGGELDESGEKYTRPSVGSNFLPVRPHTPPLAVPLGGFHGSRRTA